MKELRFIALTVSFVILLFVFGTFSQQRIFATTVVTGTATLPTAAINSATCAATYTVTAAGVLSTDIISASANATLTATTGYSPSTSGGLSINFWPGSGTVNFDVCNWSASSITPGAVTLNWRVSR